MKFKPINGPRILKHWCKIRVSFQNNQFFKSFSGSTTDRKMLSIHTRTCTILSRLLKWGSIQQKLRTKEK